jgi:hypothetical protein
VASKSAQQEPEKAEVIEEALDELDQSLDRLKVLYEQYFLGIQKQPPQFVHTEVERKLRELAQLQIRNTALRYRFVTLQQKFGSYNTYWRRTLREIEAGRYHRSLSKITRQAAVTGAEIPHEILAAMPRRMREQVRRDREAALAIQRRRAGVREDAEPSLQTIEDEVDPIFARGPAGRVHVLDEADPELDLEAFLRAVEADVDGAAGAPPAKPAKPPPIPAAARLTPPMGTSIPPPIPAAARQTPSTGTPILPSSRQPPPPPAGPPTGSPRRPPPGMTEADVNALYASYVKAKERIGQAPGPGAFGKLMQTIHAQAPKIMERYRAKGVDFSVVVQDDQVIIRAKPKM